MGFGLRLAAELAYPPALLFGGDSAQYLKLAFSGDPVGIAFERPSGYPLIIGALTLPARELAVVTTFQHAAGLLSGVLAYAIMLRLAVPRAAAALAAGLVLLDGCAIALEQHILTEAFFTLALVGAMFLTIGRERGPAALAGAGVLIASASLMRTAGLFAVPVWLAYVAWRHRRPAQISAAAMALALPMLAYAAWHDAETGDFGLTGASGWYLYARVAEIGDCEGVDVPDHGRPLCRRIPRDSREGPSYALFNPDGIVHRAFGPLTGDEEREERVDTALRRTALAIIRERPFEYLGLVGEDLLRYLRPGSDSGYISDEAISFREDDALTPLVERVRQPHLPDFEPEARAPAGALRAYADVVHTPRWLVGPLLLLALLAFALRTRHRSEIALLVGVGVSLVVGVTATSDFAIRYLLPAMPLIVCGSAVAAAEVHRSYRITATRAS